MRIRLVGLSLGVALMVAAPAFANGIKAGQYTIAHIQDICLKGDGTWYGTNFNFSGQWINDPSTLHTRAAIYGNYEVQGQYNGYGNTTLSVHNVGGNPAVYWYDWYDDFSYANYTDLDFIFVKKSCDPPFTGENTHAASE